MVCLGCRFENGEPCCLPKSPPVGTRKVQAVTRSPGTAGLRGAPDPLFTVPAASGAASPPLAPLPTSGQPGPLPHLLALRVRTSAVCGGGFSVFTSRPGLTPGAYRDAANLKCSNTGEGRGTASSSRLHASSSSPSQACNHCPGLSPATLGHTLSLTCFQGAHP